MPDWLSRLAERTEAIDALADWFDADRPVYLVLDQRRRPETCAALFGLPGVERHMTLFAGTPLSSLLPASPWLFELTLGSDAWRRGEALCRESPIGWACQPAPGVTLDDLTMHLQRLFVLDDTRGGKSLINLQTPTAWMALLAASEPVQLTHWQGPLERMATPTPQGDWRGWRLVQDDDAVDALHDLAADPRLTHGLERALTESRHAWWLSGATSTPLQELPSVWLERLKRLRGAGITRADHLRRLLTLIRHDGQWDDRRVDDLLTADLPPRKAVQALEQLP